eukprot:scaffold41798_cov372-Skeletonema_dohrnii-CCMP3373.AAC.2
METSTEQIQVTESHKDYNNNERTPLESEAGLDQGTNQMTRITSAGNVTRLRGHTGTGNTFTGTIIKALIRRRDCRRTDRRELT